MTSIAEAALNGLQVSVDFQGGQEAQWLTQCRFKEVSDILSVHGHLDADRYQSEKFYSAGNVPDIVMVLIAERYNTNGLNPNSMNSYCGQREQTWRSKKIS